jgi:hypothetical protein
MASCFFVLRQFDDVLIYLKSIESYFPTDEAFVFNYGIARAAAGQTRDAEAGLLSLQVGRRQRRAAAARPQTDRSRARAPASSWSAPSSRLGLAGAPSRLLLPPVL